ncbi:MAG TPA: hypothetical protein VF476_05520 [Chitinophagaceae bacterium]
MNINRHNYEEFFILYLDNELSSDDLRQVEEFAALNPDLKEELDVLLQSRLSPDQHITFEGKEELLRFADLSLAISMTNYEEWLVMYMDEELDAEGKIGVEKFAAANPQVQEELNLFVKTKLQPEAVLFPNKESLYRREEKVRRIPAWWRIAAAAALILAVSTTAIVTLNNKPKAGDVDLAKNDSTVPQTTKPATELATNSKDQVEPAKDNAPIAQPDKIANAASLAVNDIRNTASKKKQTDQPVVKEEELVAAKTPGNNNLPLPDQNPNVNPVLINDVVAKAESLPAKELTNSPETKYTAPVTKDIVQPSFVSTSTTNDDVEMDEPDGKKNKLRGFFRKITRTFEKRTKIDPTDGEDRLLVAGLSIKLK